MCHTGAAARAQLGDIAGFHSKTSVRCVCALGVRCEDDFTGSILAKNSYTRDVAEGAIRSGAVDFVVFAHPEFVAPDLTVAATLSDEEQPVDLWGVRESDG